MMKLKTNYVLLTVLLVIGGISSTVLAIPLLTDSINPLSTSSLHIKPAHLQIDNLTWATGVNSSTLEGTYLKLTNTDIIAHRFHLVVQIACLSSGAGALFPPKPFPCAAGENTTMILQGGSSDCISINFDAAIDPSRTPVENLNYIATEIDTEAMSTGSLPA